MWNGKTDDNGRDMNNMRNMTCGNRRYKIGDRDTKRKTKENEEGVSVF